MTMTARHNHHQAIWTSTRLSRRWKRQIKQLNVYCKHCKNRQVKVHPSSFVSKRAGMVALFILQKVMISKQLKSNDCAFCPSTNLTLTPEFLNLSLDMVCLICRLFPRLMLLGYCLSTVSLGRDCQGDRNNVQQCRLHPGEIGDLSRLLEDCTGAWTSETHI